MKIPQFVAASSLCTLCSAFPLLHLDQILRKREPQSYSVVPVDGGQPSGVSVQTVTDQIVQTSVTTILSTIVVTQSNIPTTVVVTSIAAVTITQAAAPITVPAPAETKTVLIPGSMTSSPYDDGMWHTKYYTSWLVTPSASLPTTTSVPSQSSVGTPISNSTTIVRSSSTTATLSNSLSTASPSTTTIVSSHSSTQLLISSSTTISLPSSSKAPSTSSAAISVSSSSRAPSTSSTRNVSSSQTTSSTAVPSISTPRVAIAATPTSASAVLSTVTSAASSATTTNWVTAYGQWHDHPNENGSWWWK